MGNLTNLANVKAWLGISTPDPNRDATLTRLISAQSRYIESWLSRTIQAQTYVERQDVNQLARSGFLLSFRNEPTSSVQSLSINGFDIQASNDGGVTQPGYGFDSTSLWLIGGTPNIDNLTIASLLRCTVTYVGGFIVLPFGQASSNRWLLEAERQTIPAAGPYTIATNFLWLADNSVNFVDDGTQLTKVPDSPAIGQYSVAAGVYEFNGADANRGVALSYSYVPSDLEQQCIELVSLRWREKDRIGLVSQAVGTETTTYYQKDMPAQVATDLQQYKRTFVV